MSPRYPFPLRRLVTSDAAVDHMLFGLLNAQRTRKNGTFEDVKSNTYVSAFCSYG